jgi:hypothetical protein
MKNDPDLAELLNSTLSPWPDESGARTQELQRLHTRLTRERDKLLALVRSVNSGTKGGQAGLFLDPGAVLPAVAALKNGGWLLKQEPPESGPVGDWAQLAKLYREIQQALLPAAILERESRLQWLADVEQAFGTDAKRSEIVATLTKARDAAVSAGVAGSKAAPLQQSLDQFQSAQFDDAVRSALSLRSEEDALRFLPQYGRARANATAAASQFIQIAGDFVTNVSAELTNLEHQMGSSGDTIRQDVDIIDHSLTSILNEWSEAP